MVKCICELPGNCFGTRWKQNNLCSKWRGIWKIATQTGLYSLFAAYVVLPWGQDRTHLNCFILIAGSKCQTTVHISLCLIRNDCIGAPRATNCDVFILKGVILQTKNKKVQSLIISTICCYRSHVLSQQWHLEVWHKAVSLIISMYSVVPFQSKQFIIVILYTVIVHI